MYPLYMGRLHGRDHGVHDHVHVWTVYTAVQVPCTYTAVMYTGVFTDRVHSRCPPERPCTDPCTRPITGHVHGPFMTQTQPCTLYPGVFTAHVHGCSRPYTPDPVHGHTYPNTDMYTAVYCAHGRLRLVHGRVNVLCTWPCTGRVRYTAMYRPQGRLYGLCTRPCTACVHGRECTGYTTVHGPCTLYTGVFTFSAHEHGTFYGPCTRPCTRPCTGRVHSQRPCSRSVHRGHGCERPCILSVNTTVYTVHDSADRP